MYRITVEKFGYDEKELLANSVDELKAVVILASEAEYEIISVERYNYELAAEFLQEITEKTKPEELIYGKEDKEE